MIRTQYGFLLECKIYNWVSISYMPYMKDTMVRDGDSLMKKNINLKTITKLMLFGLNLLEQKMADTKSL